jgi:hypothetical protein
MALNLSELKKRAREYVEMEAHTSVTGVRFRRRFTLFGQQDVALEVRTTDKTDPVWWVIGGGSPMNLYSQRQFPDVDAAFSLHSGLMLRIADRNFVESRKAPVDIGYDAFISHATEDKEKLVKPLAMALRKRGFRIWYDQFEMRVGDSLRQSIDRGLASSRFGIVVLSKAFFAKNWPQYELNGLLAKEIDGARVILPIWHNVTRAQVLKYSPTLADKVALVSTKRTPSQLATDLAKVLSCS